MTIYPQLVNISSEIILILQNMLIYTLCIDCRELHLRTFCRQIHQCARIGGRGGGLSQFWQCQDFNSAWHWNPSLRAIVYTFYFCCPTVIAAIISKSRMMVTFDGTNFRSLIDLLTKYACHHLPVLLSSCTWWKAKMEKVTTLSIFNLVISIHYTRH